MSKRRRLSLEFFFFCLYDTHYFSFCLFKYIFLHRFIFTSFSLPPLDKLILFKAFPSNCVITQKSLPYQLSLFFSTSSFPAVPSFYLYTHVQDLLGNFVAILSIPFSLKTSFFNKQYALLLFFLITFQPLYIHCSLASVLITLLKLFLLKLPENLENCPYL